MRARISLMTMGEELVLTIQVRDAVTCAAVAFLLVAAAAAASAIPAGVAARLDPLRALRSD